MANAQTFAPPADWQRSPSPGRAAGASRYQALRSALSELAPDLGPQQLSREQVSFAAQAINEDVIALSHLASAEAAAKTTSLPAPLVFGLNRVGFRSDPITLLAQRDEQINEGLVDGLGAGVLTSDETLTPKDLRPMLVSARATHALTPAEEGAPAALDDLLAVDIPERDLRLGLINRYLQHDGPAEAFLGQEARAADGVPTEQLDGALQTLGLASLTGGTCP